jgi:hypothetical protein
MTLLPCSGAMAGASMCQAAVRVVCAGSQPRISAAATACRGMAETRNHAKTIRWHAMQKHSRNVPVPADATRTH